MAYLLDTDIISWNVRPRPHPGVVERLRQLAETELFTSAITLGEPLFGARRSGAAALLRRIESLTDRLRILPFDEEAAHVYGSLRANLEQSGVVVADPDLRIACIALSAGLTLVTGNVRHFAPIPGLTIENWLT